MGKRSPARALPGFFDSGSIVIVSLGES